MKIFNNSSGKNINNICDICYDKKEVKDITCCKGKKWCFDCESKTKNLLNNCPFCRFKFDKKIKNKRKHPEYLMNRPYPGQRFFFLSHV